MSAVARYERKFLTEFSAADIFPIILLHPMHFHEIYHERQVFSLYFDTPHYDYYQENLLGSPHRRKVRLRWYADPGDDWFSPPKELQLEVKHRQGETMKKWSEPLQWKKGSADWLSQVTHDLRHALAPNLGEAEHLEPVLFNAYTRRYFAQSNEVYRITVDQNLQFANVPDWLHRRTTRELPFSIVECKYSLPEDIGFEKVTQSFPFRLTKSSKYILGMQQCLPQLQ